MDHTAYVKPAGAARPIQKPRPLQLGFDVPMVLVVVSLTVIGLLMVYSASWNYTLRNGESASYILNRQIMWALVGGALAALLTFINYHYYQRLVVPAMAVTMVLLLAVLFINDNNTGPTRTLFNGSIQPSELAKLTIIIYLSAWLYSKRDVLSNISFGLLPIMVILGITAGLILLEPDLSAAATVIMLGGLLFFLANGELRQIVLVLVVVCLLGALVVNISDTGRQRFTDYVMGLQSPEDASYHVRRSMEAVVRGGVFGVGIGKGTTKFTGLPVPWTDSIFAVIVEETGLLGGTVIILLYLFFLWRGLKIAQRAPDMLGKLLAAGVTLWVALEALINIGVMVNVIPFAGNALPFMSAGGSNMVTTLAGIGILLSVSRSSIAEKSATEGRSFGAVIDLRGRDRRRGVSRGNRSAGSRR
ncbi:MAG: FtsW/RodA/SpoVE family cell cycle protein [Chloroflexi bacterium]|nr:FtsW/RodA/SpoVE family cell cycle protein [Anaerolineaceae bacterium]NMB88073.1 FtsW/RodA/SpoVE family cell cycle protein [Chloroflexota bacterium]